MKLTIAPTAISLLAVLSSLKPPWPLHAREAARTTPSPQAECLIYSVFVSRLQIYLLTTPGIVLAKTSRCATQRRTEASFGGLFLGNAMPASSKMSGQKPQTTHGGLSAVHGQLLTVQRLLRRVTSSCRKYEGSSRPAEMEMDYSRLDTCER